MAEPLAVDPTGLSAAAAKLAGLVFPQASGADRGQRNGFGGSSNQRDHAKHRIAGQ